MYENLDVSCKSKPEGKYEDGKIYLLRKLQINTNPDNTTDSILKYEASIIWSVM